MEPETVSLTEEEKQRYARAAPGSEIGFGQRPALLIIDFMYGFTDPTEAFGANMDEAVSSTAGLLHLARQKGIPVVFAVVHYDEACPSQLGIWVKKMPALPQLKTGSRLVEIDERVKPAAGETVIVKKGPSAFFGTYLASLLINLGVDTIIITGCTTSGCIRATVVDALQYNFRPIVPRECVADRAKGPHEANLFDIHQKYGDVVSVQRVIDHLDALPDKKS